MNFRQKNAFISYIFIVICIVVLSIARLQGFALYGTILFFGITYYFLVYWLFNFQVYPQGFLTILLLPAATFVSFLLLNVYFIKSLGFPSIFFSTIVFGIFQYYLILTQNILNRSKFDVVPLSQAALVANNFFSIIGFFFTSLSIIIIPDMNIYIRLFLIFIMAVVLLLAFMLTNEIDLINYVVSVLVFALSTLFFAILFLTSAIEISSIVGVALVQSLIYRAITLVTLYGVRKVISVGDRFQITLEGIAATVILIYMYILSNSL